MSVRRQIIAALSEDSLGGIATLHDVAHAEQMVDAHRAEVLREAADMMHAMADPQCSCGGCDSCSARGFAEELRKKAGEKSSRPAADATPEYSEARYGRYITALRAADTYAQLERGEDLRRFARAAMQAADTELDPVYRDAYAIGRTHAGAAGWRLRDFVPVFTTSDGTDHPATELRCSICDGLVQGAGPQSLIDLMALAAQHECPNTRKGGAL